MINRPLYVDKIMAYTDTPFVKVLTGVRRCGKSTVLKMIMEKLQQEHDIPSERIVSMRFDSMDYEDMTAKDMFKAVKEKLNPTGSLLLSPSLQSPELHPERDTFSQLDLAFL